MKGELQSTDWRYKAWPESADAGMPERKWNVLEGDFATPVLVLKESALDHNIRVMASYCRERGVSLAPHGKTYMSPGVLDRQLDAGAWGVTAATISQVRVFRALGARRVLMANQLVDPAGLAWAATCLAHTDFQFMCLVDSEAGVDLMNATLGSSGAGGRLSVLVELGFEGGRTGARTASEAIAVARAVARSPFLQLAGVEGYEGIMDAGSIDATRGAVEAFMRRVRRLAIALDDERAFDHLDEIVVSAGGSAFFDVVVDVLGGEWQLSRPVRIVLRGGCYATHDSGMYRRLSPFERAREGPRLRAALELWSTVTSRPESSLAIANFGKRDVSHDVEMPIPLAVWRRATRAFSDASGLKIEALNDQHAYVHLEDAVLHVGDMLCCGISHPCTTFDKWRLIPMVDDHYTVTGAAETYF